MTVIKQRKRKGVSMIVDEDFFKIFERDRNIARTQLNLTNLTVKDFTGMVAKTNFSFGQPIRRRKKKK